MAIEIRSITKDEIPDFRQIVGRAFGEELVNDEEAVQRFADQVDLARTYVPFDGADIVGAAASLSFDVSLPGGGVTPMGGLTMVAVAPTHRRQGLLNRLMSAHFDDCRERGEAVSGLWASESVIYGRYGYGDAAPAYDLAIDARNVGMPDTSDDVRIVDAQTARQAFPQIYNKVLATRPGLLARSDVWWEHRHFRDPEHWRQGASERRYLVAYRDGEPVGYTTYRQKSKWKDAIADGAVIVGEVVGVDANATLSLWAIVCAVDLFPNVTAENQPLDIDLLWQVANPRVIRRNVLDGLYVRILDVAKALEARRYAVADSMVIEISDPMGIAAGRFRIEAAADGSSCVSTTDDPDVSMDVRTLSTLYLGSAGAAGLARVGRIVGQPAATRRFGALFRSDVAPWCAEVF